MITIASALNPVGCDVIASLPRRARRSHALPLRSPFGERGYPIHLCRDAVPILPVIGGSGWRLGNALPATYQPGRVSSIQPSCAAFLVNGPTCQRVN